MTNIDFRDLGPKLLKKRKSVLTAGLVAGDGTNPYSIRIVFNDDADFRDEKKVSKFLKKHNITLNSSTTIPSEFDTKDSLFLRISNSYPEGSTDVRNKITPDPVQSGFSIGNVPWFTDGSATGILEIQIDGGLSKNYLLSIHHVLLGEDGNPGDDVSVPSARYLLGKDYSQYIVGQTSNHFQTPVGTEWALALLNTTSIVPEIKSLNPPVKPFYDSNQPKPNIGDYVVKSGYGSNVTYGQIVAIHVFAKVEDGSYLEGFEIAPVKPIKAGSDIIDFDPSELPFAVNSDSGGPILRMEKDTTTNIYSVQPSPIGILALMTGQDDSDVEFGYAIYFDEVMTSIENHFQGHTINKLNFIQ